MKKDKWQLDDTSKHFITFLLKDGKKEIIEFRGRWELGYVGLENESLFPAWKKKIEEECQDLRREIRVSEIEFYFNAGGILVKHPISSSRLEGGPREENWGDSFPAVFALEIRALGRKIGFPQEWDHFLEYYVIYNRKKFNLIFNRGITISIRYRLNEEFGLLSENICLTLGENTISPDLENLWGKQITPLLNNLLVRIRGKKRIAKDAPILKKLIEEGIKTKISERTRIDQETNKEVRSFDVEIATSLMTDEELDKLYEGPIGEKQIEMEKILSRKVQNKRYYHSKRRPLR